jgi:hypothetical protein
MTHASKARMTPAWRVGAEIFVALALAIAPASTSRGQAEPQELAPVPGTYRTDRLGLEFRLLPYRGHYGARLTRPPAAGSPFLKLRRPEGSPTYLESGDMIVTLDDQIIDGPADIENHVVRTKVDFVNIRTGRVEVVWAMLPNDARPGPSLRPDPGPAPPPVPPSPPDTNPGPAPDVRIVPAAGESRRIRAVLVVDTETKFQAIKNNLELMLAILEPFRAERRCDITVLTEDRATAAGMRAAIRACGDVSSDTLLVYYTGHGLTDLGRGHALNFTRGPALLRADVREEMAALRPRLGVLLTECCSILDVLPPSKMGKSPIPGEAPDDRMRIAQSLLLRTRGVVDINSSSFDPRARLNEASILSGSGGLFTSAIFDSVLNAIFAKLDENHDGLLTWGEFLPLVQAHVKLSYRSIRIGLIEAAKLPPSSGIHVAKDMAERLLKQPNQTPQPFALDGPTYTILTGPPFEPGAQFSARTLADPSFRGEVVGARVDAITDADAPFGKALQVGDVVTALNGRKFPTPALMLERLDAIAPLNKVRVYRPADSSFREINLPPAPPPRDQLPNMPLPAPSAPGVPTPPEAPR